MKWSVRHFPFPAISPEEKSAGSLLAAGLAGGRGGPTRSSEGSDWVQRNGEKNLCGCRCAVSVLLVVEVCQDYSGEGREAGEFS